MTFLVAIYILGGNLNTWLLIFFFILWQVIDGGDLDINFMVTSPHGRIMVSELMKSDAVHK